MARPLSEEKRTALLDAAAELVASTGVGATTARIAKRAGVSEGTLFTYFANKDVLFNELFIAMERELSAMLLEGYPAEGDVRERTWHVWSRYVDWGAVRPFHRRALYQLKASDRITPDNLRKGGALFQRIRTVLEDELGAHLARDTDYARAALTALAETTMDFVVAHPRKHEHYKRAGFETFWKGVAG